jgi:transposase
MDLRRPYGRHYPTWVRKAALLNPTVAKGLGISDRTIRRWKQRQRLTGSLEPGPYSSGRPRRLTTQQMFLVAIYMLAYPGKDITNSFSHFFYY